MDERGEMREAADAVRAGGRAAGTAGGRTTFSRPTGPVQGVRGQGAEGCGVPGHVRSSATPPPGPLDRPRRGRLSALQVATYGVLAALALVCGYVEALVPLPIPIPGVKLGLGNVVVLFSLVALGVRPALVIMLVKVIASALLFGNPTVFAYSLAGGVTSLCAMALASRVRALSVPGLSMVGGVFHMMGQMAVVAVVLTPQIALAYLPPLLVAGLASGLVVGYLCRLVLRATASSAILRAQRKRVGMGPRRTGAARAGDVRLTVQDRANRERGAGAHERDGAGGGGDADAR